MKKWKAENILGYPRMGNVPKIIDENGDLIARIAGGDLKNAEDNALLLASAPEMLEYLKRIVDAQYSPGGTLSALNGQCASARNFLREHNYINRRSIMRNHEEIKNSDAIYYCDNCYEDKPCRLILDQEDTEPSVCIHGDSNPEWKLFDRNQERNRTIGEI